MSPCERSEEPCPRGRWKHGAIPVIGLIGGIGSGKSHAASLLASRGAAVIDADAVGHQLLGDSKILAQIVEQFGEGVLVGPREDGETTPRIDRRALGAIVFADPSARRTLEAMLHPLMRARFLEDINRVVQRGAARLVVLDAAVLLEAGWDDLCDRIVFVDAPRADRLRRVTETRGWSEETLSARERSQWPYDEKRRRAEWIITNDSRRDRLPQEVDRLISQLLDPAGLAEGPVTAPLRNTTDSPVDAVPDKLVLNAPAPVGRMS